MPDLLIRNLEPPLLARLETRAKNNHRSLQAELRAMLGEAAAEPDEVSFDRVSFAEAVRFADQMRRKTAGKITGDSTDFIREDRDR